MVPYWKKKEFGNEVYGAGIVTEGSTLNHFAKMFVLNILKVDGSNANYRNPLMLTEKAFGVRQPGSNMSIILKFINNHPGTEEEKIEVRNSLYVKKFVLKVIIVVFYFLHMF